MKKLYTQIIGTFVFIDSPRPVATVKDCIIDPDTGTLLAFLVRPNTNEIIVPRDIIRFKKHIFLHSYDDIFPAEEVIRVQEAQQSRAKIIKTQVFTELGTYLGNVYDYEIDLPTYKIQKLHVAKSIFGLIRYQHKIIDQKHILEITHKKITVRDLTIKKPSKKLPMVAIGS